MEFCQLSANRLTYTSLAKSIRRTRTAKGLIQKELASLVGVNPKTVARWEQGGHPHARHMSALVRVLGLPQSLVYEHMR